MENRREFFRLKLSVPFTFSIPHVGQPQVSPKQVFTYRTQDLSGGGLRFETPNPMKAGDEMQLCLRPADLESIRINVRVVWARKLRSPGGNVYVGGVEFQDLAAAAQDRIIGYLFRAQIEARKKSRPREGQSPV